MQSLRVLETGKFDDRGYSNEESIAYLQLTKPTEINSFLTYNYGKDDDRFPLMFYTEGQGSKGSVEVPTIQWTWDTMGRMKFTDCVVYFNTAITQPGLGGTEFEVEFASHWFIEQHGAIAPDGKTMVRIQKDLGEGIRGYRYLLRLDSPNPDAFVDPALLAVGKYWSLSAPTVSESYSKGNRSNSMGPGKMTSQLEKYRFSKEIAGPHANVVTKYQFENANGSGTTNLWINEEMRQFNLHMRVMNEERLWTAKYNRLPDGTIAMKDHDNGKPVERTAGMLEICRESNYDTYGEFLTLNKLERTIGDVLDRDTEDTADKNVILMGGKGFIRDFDAAVRMDAKDNGFLTPLGEKMIQDNGNGLAYGKYFNKYKTVDGYTITVVHNGYFDKSTIAEAAKQNGMIHPQSGLPITSHRAALIDMSSYKGHPNVRIVHRKGDNYKAKVYKGMSDVPASWGLGNDTTIISTDVDMSSLEIMGTIGLQVDNTTKMMLLECVL